MGIKSVVNKKKLILLVVVLFILLILATVAIWMTYRTTAANLMHLEGSIQSITVQSTAGMHDSIPVYYTYDSENIQKFIETTKQLPVRLDSIIFPNNRVIESDDAIWNVSITFRDQTSHAVTLTSDGYLYTEYIRYAVLEPEKLINVFDCVTTWSTD